MPRSCALVRVVFASAFVVMLAQAIATQVPAPNGPTGTRRVHPTIANPAPGVPLVASPHFAVPDGVWNHGEGFPPLTTPATPAADYGGWHGNDDGTHVTSADVHQLGGTPSWTNFTWVNPFHSAGNTVISRFEGWLRPASVPALPTTHPLYGPVGSYVDQGAFELFCPVTARQPGQKIVICILNQESLGFPLDKDDKSLGWYQTYRGIFSPDGLVRREPQGQPRVPSTFLGNTNDNDVERPLLNLVAAWPPNSNYWPIAGYPVLSVMHRQTTLNEQRNLQLVQAIKCLLRENSARNPLGAGNQLTDQQIESEVVVFFTGGSNGGLQSQLAMLTHPHIVHGAFAVAINPSLQRFYGEHDLGHALARLSGQAFIGAGIVGNDFLHWNQYPWSHGLEMHDLSVLRHFVADITYRPSCFTVGDEDITSTGTDWVAVANDGAWTDHGVKLSNSSFGSPAAHRFAWMVAENACHDNQAPVTNAYSPAGPEYQYYDLAHHTILDAIGQRTAELANPQPIQLPQHHARVPAQQRHGLDDPQEWFLGREGEAIDAATGTPAGVLLRDDAWGNAVQAQGAGTQPGRREAMLIRDHAVYVGSAEGIVSKFVVDTTDTRMPLVRVAKSRRLGHEAYALCALETGGTWQLVVGTRRHLYLLDSGTLDVQAGPAELPWEVAQPHHMKVADVLPGHLGQEIVFATIHGGLVFYDVGLNPIHEWPEPGIADFAIDNGAVVLLSERGLLAKVTFSGANHAATLQAASNPLDVVPSQGSPRDLEVMRANWGVLGVNTFAISRWTSDTDGEAVRGHRLSNLAAQQYLQNIPGIVTDIATCIEGNVNGATPIGDHLLVLRTDGTLSLFDQFAVKVGEKNLTTTTQPGNGYYPFAAGAHTLAVGDLVDSSGLYLQEVVVATATGLMWLHIDELLGTGTALPAPAAGVGFWVQGGGGAGTNVQPRTNQTTAAAWAIARKPVPGDNDLHVLDQRGVYWKVSGTGQVRLQERDRLIVAGGARGWGYVGAVNAAPGFQSTFENLRVLVLGAITAIETTQWCPRKTTDLVYENTSHYWPNNWSRRNLAKGVFEGFLVHGAGGDVIATGTGREAWFWTHVPEGAGLDPWGNLVEGLRFDGSGAIDGIWASTARPVTVTGTPPNEIGDKGVFHTFRSYISNVPIMTQQAVRAVRLTRLTANPEDDQTAVVLCRPGGRVSVLLPGALRTDDSPSPGGDHQLGPNPADETADLGYGVSALAVRHEMTASTEQVRIWCGTISHPSKRPAAYGTASASLADDEVATGAVHQMVWTPGTPGTFTPIGAPVAFHPSGARPRGAYGVVGLLLADLLPEAQSPGDELVVGTLSGDLFVLNAGTMAEVWRTHLPGDVGHYNSMLAEDLDGQPGKELYVAGSWGLWRFTLDPQQP